ncbi:MAG: hypothetical protein AAGL66_01365 [Pseudomonadota bacterium]
MLLTAAAIYGYAVYHAVTTPPVYEAKATILVEDQSVSADFVRATNTGFASQQIEVSRRRVLTVDTVADIVNRNRLYRKRDGLPRVASPELSRRFRRDMSIELVSAETMNPKSFRPQEITIAFTVAFRARKANKAKNVVDELVTLFLNENQRDRSSVATNTSEFLTAEASRLNTELEGLGQELADFKVANDGSLPEQYEFNLDALARAQTKLSQSSLRLQQLQKQQIEFRSRLAGIEPFVAADSKKAASSLNDIDRLRALQTELRRKAAIYKDNHPDIVRLNREIADLQQSLGVGTDVADLTRQLEQQRASLADLRQKYADDFFEVRNAERVLRELETRVSEARAESRERVQEQSTPNNPAYLLVASQLESVEVELEAVRAERAAMESRIGELEELLRRAPNVEREYNTLVRNYENANDKYQDVKAKAREASVASNLEVEQKGERFIVIEPAFAPIHPISPNRPAIVLIGVVLALGAGIGVALVRDTLKGAMHGAADVMRYVGAPPIAVVPYLQTAEEMQRRQRLLYAAMVCALALGAALGAYFYLGMEIGL